MKRTAIVGGVVLLALAGVVLALPFIIDVNRYRGQLQTAIQERVGREVTLGRMAISLLPLGLRVEDAVIGDDPAFGTERPFARVEELYVSPRFFPLLRGQFELRSVELRRPEIELVRNADGVWNFATLGGPDGAGAPAGAEGSSSSFVLNHLAITSGRVALTDGQRGRSVYDNIDLEIEDYAADRPFTLALGATLPGEGTQRLSLSGRAGPVAQDAIAMTPFDGRLELDDVSIGGVQQFLQLEALEGTDAIISGGADLQNREGLMSGSGSLRLDDARARGVEIGYPIGAEFDLSHDTGAERLTVEKGTLRLGDTPLSLTGTVDLQPQTPVLDVHVTAADASLAEAARLASAFGVAFGAGTDVAGRLNADVRARGPADRPALDGNVRLRDVSISGADIPQPVRTAAVDVALTPQEIRTNEFTAGTGGTSLGVRVTVRQYTTPTPVLDARVHTTDADLGEVLNVARAWGAEAAEGTTATGRLTVDVRATGPFDTLAYSGSGRLGDATITTPAITQPLRVRSATLSFSQNTAVLENLAASVGKTNAEGRLTVRNFSSPQVQFQLSADTIDVKELQEILAAGEKGEAEPSQAQTSDSVLLRTTGNGSMRVGSITYDRLLLEDVQATATLDRGLMTLDPLTAALFGGRHRGSIVVDARRTPASFTVSSDLEKVDANRLASAVTSVRDVIYGALGTRARVSFAADGGDNIAQSLNGSLSVNLAEGRIANMDITREVGNIARFVTGQGQAERSTSIAGLSGNFDVRNGVARTQDLRASIEGGTMGATGTINLVDQSLDLRLTTVLSREYTDRVGGTKVGGFMATALANQQGELVVPLIVTGTLQQPRFAPDAQRVAEMKVKNLVPGLRNPQDLTSSILGAVTGQQKEGQAPRDTLGNIVGAITGRGAAPAEEQQKPGTAAQEPAAQEPAAKPEAKDPARQVEDALRGLLRGRREPEQKPAPEAEKEK
jgi:AsmA protein